MPTPADTSPDPVPPPARQVACPTCRQPALYAPSNPFRPFCSARCQGQDFGAWATETYRVDGPPPVDDPA